MISLSDQERNKLAAYLEQEISSNDQIIKQMGKLPPNPATDLMIDKMRNEMAAMFMIASRFRSTETQTIGEGTSESS